MLTNIPELPAGASLETRAAHAAVIAAEHALWGALRAYRYRLGVDAVRDPDQRVPPTAGWEDPDYRAYTVHDAIGIKRPEAEPEPEPKLTAEEKRELRANYQPALDDDPMVLRLLDEHAELDRGAGCDV